MSPESRSRSSPTPKLNAMRVLDRLAIAYTVHTFPDSLHSAEAVAAHLGVAPGRVYKTLVALCGDGKPLLVMLAGDAVLDVKRLARAIGAKDVRMAAHDVAERLTGLRTGGISALALGHKRWPVYLDRAALGVAGGRLLVSAGQRGVNVEISPRDLVRATGATVVDTTAAEA